jgi:hypothetical protein
MTTMRPLMLLILLLSVALPAEDTRMYQRSDGGYDFFDFSGMLVFYSVPNEKGSYNYFDRTGRAIGWAEAKGGNRIEFFDASGTLYRVLERSADGGVAISSALGRLYNISTPNIVGGTDNYDPKGLLTSFTMNGEFTVVNPNPSE